MKKNIQKTIAVLGAAVLATGMVGCGSSNTNTSAADTSADSSAAESGAAADTTENSADTKDLSGSITLAGSTSMEKFANALAETFMEKYPNVTVQAGIKAIGVPCIPFGTLTRLICSRRPANSVSAKPKPSAVENA